jgi:branched-chain amino acid transport system permease protein
MAVVHPAPGPASAREKTTGGAPREAPRGARPGRAAGSPLRRAVVTGLIFGGLAAYLAIVGILTLISGRWIIVQTLSLGHAALLATAVGAGIMVARHEKDLATLSQGLLGAVAGAIVGGALAVLIAAMSVLDLRPIFIALSPALFKILTLHLQPAEGALLLIVAGAAFGALGALLPASPAILRRPLLFGCAAVTFFGVFQELIQIMMQREGLTEDLRNALFTWEGLTIQGAVAIFLVAVAASVLATKLRPRRIAFAARLTPTRQGQLRVAKALAGLLLLVAFPLLAGSYIGQVLMLVGLYILMGMGLNLEVGLAGLLDLGFVAFFAVGAYTTALLTADSSHALSAYTMLPTLPYWAAMPVAVMMSVIVGVVFGLPVLGVRGDYLAVATMGLGEIVRVIVQSDFAAPLLAGAQGILQIPKPKLFGLELADPVDLFYLTLIAAGLAAYCAWRLENSRLGRAWMALRDDEDVAQALGVNLVEVKLLAYGLGAAFAGLAGSIFAVMLTSVYPSSFQLLISINVLALVIVGGMGSLPGVIVGSVALVGLPELLREFGEYRYLFYGAALIVMMRIKPEGLWPSRARLRELRGDEAVAEHDNPDADAIAVSPDADLRESGEHRSRV